MLTAAVLLSVNCSRSSDQSSGASYGSYSYYYFESTDANKCIMIDGVQHSIEFDPRTSQAAAVEALLSLKWNVLYPNSKGIITLFGSCQKDKGTFSLIHWQLPAPFKAYAGTLTSEPGELQARDFLVPSDFDKDIKEDPRTYNRPPEAKP